MLDIENFIAEPGKNLDLNDFSTSDTAGLDSKKSAKKHLKENIKEMRELQGKLYAQDKYSLLLVFQAMDAAGKDSTIKHVMSGLNPQGTQVRSFKQPSSEELDHDYLWRIHKAAPERGRIGIFNRSHYEEVLVVKVHNLISNQKIPSEFIDEDIWQTRYREINDFEKMLFENGTKILKFFLHVSKEEQKKRFIKRIDRPDKNWKFSAADIEERKYWDKYQKTYAEAISATSKKHAPWFIIPADHKWFMRLAVSQIIVDEMKKMKIDYPELEKDKIEDLQKYKKLLENE